MDTTPSSSHPLLAVQLTTGDWLYLCTTYIAIGAHSIWLSEVIETGIETIPTSAPPGFATVVVLGAHGGYRYTPAPAQPDQAREFLEVLYRLRPDLRPTDAPSDTTPDTTPVSKPLLQTALGSAQAGLRATRPAVSNALTGIQSGVRSGVRSSRPLLRNALFSARAGTAKLRASLPTVRIQVTPPGRTPNQPLTAPSADPVEQTNFTVDDQSQALIAAEDLPLATVTPTSVAPAIPTSIAPVPLATTRVRDRTRSKARRSPKINSSHVVAGFSHLAGLLLPMIVPLVLWQTLQERMPFAARHAKQAFFFQVIVFFLIALTWAITAALGLAGGVFGAILSIASDIIGLITSAHSGDTGNVALTVLGFILLVSVNLMAIVALPFSLLYTILAAIKGFQGKPYHYPLLGRLWR